MLHAFITPDLSNEVVSLALVSTWRTLAYAAAGMSLAVLLAFPLGVLASDALYDGSNLSRYRIHFFKQLLGFMRAIHELVWALLFVSANGLSPFSAIFALMIPYSGMLGRMWSNTLNDVNNKPIEALKSTGASQFQILFFGYLPMAAADMMSYTMYRFECAIRSSTIMSFVGLGGLGYQIQLSLADLEYREAWTFLYFLIGLVLIVDLWSNAIRKRMVTS